MTKRKRRGSLLFPLTLIFLGVMFLLTSLDVVDSSIWYEVIRYWPVLLILLGIDTLLRRPSVGAAVGAVIGTAVLIAAGIALFYVFAPGVWITEQQAFAHPLGGTTAAEIVLSCRDCSMNVGPSSELPDSENLISGTLILRRDERLTEFVRRDGEDIQFRLESGYRFPFVLPAQRESHAWNVSLTGSIPLSLTVSTNGIINLDLTGIRLESGDISGGEAPCSITLPSSSAALYLVGHRITVKVPEDVGVRVGGSASMELTVPMDYVRTEDGILSPNYDTAAHQIDIILRPGTEWIEIKPVEADLSSPAS